MTHIGECPNRSHDPRLNAGRWTCPQCAAAAEVAVVETADTDEWSTFRRALVTARRADGTVHQCDVRPHIRGRIEPKHIGTYWRRARSEGLVAEVGHERSNDTAGRNAGRMEPFYAWKESAA